MYYIGFDIAKENHYASIANSNGEVIQEAFLVKNSINGFNFFMDKLEEKNISISDCLVGMESTGHYGENLIQFLHNKGFNIGIINPIQTDALRNSNIRKTKTDKIDTYLIIQSLMLKHYTPFVSKDIKIEFMERESVFDSTECVFPLMLSSLRLLSYYLSPNCKKTSVSDVHVSEDIPSQEEQAPEIEDGSLNGENNDDKL